MVQIEGQERKADSAFALHKSQRPAESDDSGMYPDTIARTNRMALLLLTTAALLAAGCSSTMNTTPTMNAVTGPAFVVGTDAPMAAVTSFAVQIQSISATDASGPAGR